MAQQTLRAIDEADRVLFLADARDGYAPDHFIAQTLRKRGKHVTSRQQGRRPRRATAAADFHQLGLGEPQRFRPRTARRRSSWSARSRASCAWSETDAAGRTTSASP